MESFSFGDGGPPPSSVSSAGPGPVGYSREVIDAVWQEADPIDGNDPELFRKDASGTWIHRLDYGKRNSEFGWGIEDRSSGLRPVHWQQLAAGDSAAAEAGEDADDGGGMLELF